MIESSSESSRGDEWSELLLLMMKTSLSVAHELRLTPDSTLNCAAQHLGFHNFTWFASAMHGASRAQSCCGRNRNPSTVEAAYIRILAARLKSNRNALACAPTRGVPDIHNHDEVPDQAYERVESAIAALKADILREFSHRYMSDDSISNDVSRFAKALVTIMPADGDAGRFERASAALLRVRFGLDHQVVIGHDGKSVQHPIINGDTSHASLPPAQDGWMYRIRHPLNHPKGLHD
jgi:hypothetical protein